MEHKKAEECNYRSKPCGDVDLVVVIIAMNTSHDYLVSTIFFKDMKNKYYPIIFKKVQVRSPSSYTT